MGKYLASDKILWKTSNDCRMWMSALKTKIFTVQNNESLFINWWISMFGPKPLMHTKQTECILDSKHVQNHSIAQVCFIFPNLCLLFNGEMWKSCCFHMSQWHQGLCNHKYNIPENTVTMLTNAVWHVRLDTSTV